LTLLAFAAPFLLFISFPSRFWNFDGVACAAALELGNPLFLFHSNHLLYGFLGHLFWQPLYPWALPRALPALQLFTGVLSAIGLTGLYVLLRSMLPRKELALLLIIATAATAVVWVWSVEAQVYALGFAAISWATAAIFQPAHPQKWARVGALHAAAVLGHIVHVLWIVPALYLLWKENPRARGKNLRHYLATLAAVTGIPYILVIVLLVAPPQLHPGWMDKWLMGSLALNATSTFQWHSAGWAGPFLWVSTSLKIFWGSFWPYQTTVPLWGWALTGISAAAGAFLLRRSFQKRKDARWVFCILWLAVYGIFFWTWEPTTECYRMTDMIPWAILGALGISTLKQPRLQRALAAVLAASFIPLTLRTRIYPMQDEHRNHIYQEVRHLTQRTPEDSIYLTVGGIPWIYLLYFSGRTAWNLRSFTRDPERFKREIARHLRSRPIFIRAETASIELAQSWLKDYKPRPLDPSSPWLQIQ
jgi:hypothetical protein